MCQWKADVEIEVIKIVDLFDCGVDIVIELNAWVVEKGRIKKGDLCSLVSAAGGMSLGLVAWAWLAGLGALHRWAPVSSRAGQDLWRWLSFCPGCVSPADAPLVVPQSSLTLP